MYCTVGEVLEMIKDDMKNVIIGDEYIEDEQEREAKIATLCESAISDACAEIDGYLAKRYRVPFTKTPQVINKFAKDIKRAQRSQRVRNQKAKARQRTAGTQAEVRRQQGRL